MSDQAKGFFSRWNERKQQVADEKLKDVQSQQTNDEPIINQQAPEQAVEHHDEDSAEKLLTSADLPDPNNIEIGGSFAAFMAKNVDPTAKSAALRALWKQPHFNEIDGLLEYGLDYSNQPKLSAEDSAALVKKVFRHMYQNTNDNNKTEDKSETVKSDFELPKNQQNHSLTRLEPQNSTNNIDEVKLDSSRQIDEQTNNINDTNSVPATSDTGKPSRS